jgi:ABC-type multidrug transport system fused ATPase/permease subunit
MAVILKKVWSIFSPREHLLLFALIGLLLSSSLIEIFGLAVVIPYVNAMLFEEKVRDYLTKVPALQFLPSLFGDLKSDITFWFVAFFLMRNIFLAGITFAQHSIQKRLHTNVVCRMYRSHLRKPYTFHLNNNSSTLIRSLSYDAMHFGDGVLGQGAILIAEIFLFVGVVTILSLVNPVVLLILLLMTLVLGVIFWAMRNRLVIWGEILQAGETTLIRQMQEGIGGIKDVNVFGAHRFFENSFQRVVSLRGRMKRNRDFLTLVPRYIIEIIMMFGMGVTLLLLTDGGAIEHNLSIIAFMAVAVVRMLPMSNRIMNSLSTIRACGPSVDVVYQHGRSGSYDDEPTSSLPSLSRILEPLKSIVLSDVSFSYQSKQPLLTGISFSIEMGETIGIVGSSGAGKTTLVDTLLGLLRPSRGLICCNGRDIYEDVNSWQSRIGYVSQSVFLLDDTIEANIAFGVERHLIDSQRIRSVIRLARLDAWIESLPDDQRTRVGERGGSISGGQRQRIAIARALYRDPEILIFDEATSALDNKTEKELMTDIYALKGVRTIVMVAHRLETIRNCDRIIVIDNGRVVGEGTYEYLMSSNNVFRAISAGY